MSAHSGHAKRTVLTVLEPNVKVANGKMRTALHAKTDMEYNYELSYTHSWGPFVPEMTSDMFHSLSA